MGIPQLLGDYEIGGKIGSGNMGTVYRARKRALEIETVVKVLHAHWATDPEVAARFAIEAKSAARVDHPNTVRVFDYGQQDGCLFIAMEFVDGLNLKEILRLLGAPLRDAAILIFRDLCRGLEAAHEKGVVHRDLKPENLAITSRGEVKIMDFGLARHTGQDSGLSVEGGVYGTPAYMSPEQALGRTVDQRSDIFSLGLVAYELFSGQRAYPGAKTGEVMHNILTSDPPRLSDLVPDLDPEILACVEEMTRKEIDLRCKSISTILDRLETIARRLDVHREGKVLQDLVAMAERAKAEPDGTVIKPGRRNGTKSRAGDEAAGEPGGAGSGAATDRADPLGSSQGGSFGAEPVAVENGSREAGRARGAGDAAVVPVDVDGEREAGPARGTDAPLPDREPWPAHRIDAPLPDRETEGPPARLRIAFRALAIAGAILLLGAAVLGGMRLMKRGSDEPAARAQPVLTSLEIEPPMLDLAPGQSASMKATGFFEGDSAAALTSRASWRSSDPSVASVAADGRVTALAPGETWIAASVGSITGESRLSVAAPAQTTAAEETETDGDTPRRTVTKESSTGEPSPGTGSGTPGPGVDQPPPVPMPPFRKEYLIIVRPAGSADYVFIDRDPTRHEVADIPTFSYVLAEGTHRFRIGKPPAETMLTYEVRRGDPHRKLLLWWQSGRVEPSM